MIRWLRRLSGRGRVLGGAILLALLALRVWDPDPVTIVRDRAFDFYQVIQPRPAADTAVLVVDLDEASLAEFGQWPWPRTLVADLLANLFNAGAVVVGFDVVFAEPDRLSPDRIANQFVGLSGDTKAELQALPSNDAILADVFRHTRVVVGRAALPEPTAQQNTVAPARPAIANVGGDPDPFLPEFAGMLRNIPELESTAAGHGMLSLTPELDGIVRRVPALLKIDGKIYPTFALEVLRVATGQTAMAIRTNEAGVDSVVIAGARIPTDRNGRLWVHYAKRTGDRVVSAASVLNRTAPDETIAGKLVLVGTSAVGLQDIKATTLEGGVPGVEIHAQILDMILAQSFLIRPNFALGLELSVTLVVALIVIGLVPAVGAIWTLLVGGLVALVLIAGSWALYATQGLLIDATYPAVVALAVYALLTYLSYIREELERRQVRTAFSQYMSPSLVAELAEHPDRLKLGGETKEMTFLFCDVRGFTAISESYKADPQGLTTLLNDLLTPLTDAILERRGTIDKYMGDCVMAFWNAPLDDPQHASNACQAALAMNAAIEQLNAKRRARAEASGTAFLSVHVGVGVNTGTCVVGNMGSQQRFDYSVVGDAVNLASRLEGQSKPYGVTIVVGPETAATVGAEFALLELDLIAVKGKREAVCIFALLGNAEVRRDPAFHTLTEDHAALLKAYRSQDWPAARGLADRCRANRWAPPALYDAYATRIALFQAAPPPADWDGVFVAETK